MLVSSPWGFSRDDNGHHLLYFPPLNILTYLKARQTCILFVIDKSHLLSLKLNFNKLSINTHISCHLGMKFMNRTAKGISLAYH